MKENKIAQATIFPFLLLSYGFAFLSTKKFKKTQKSPKKYLFSGQMVFVL